MLWDDGIVVCEEGGQDMPRDTTHAGLEGPISRRRREGPIKGLKLAMEGEEILSRVQERIDSYKAKFDRMRETAGTHCREDADVIAVRNRISRWR
jgi:hypothetical protein